MKEIHDIFTDYICNHIHKNKLYEGDYKIRIGSDYTFKIHYKKHYYKISIVEENNELFWKMTPYQNSYFMTKIDNYSSFNKVLFAIKEHHKIKYG